ncbi:MAG: site-specific integrase [Clostridiales bacterium]|nr:site-specific integrase [Clostridiales bacterium]
MPAYKYTLKNGKTKWYANFYYTDWTGERKHICKRGFDTQREAKAYERSFMDQEKNTSDILFSSLVENYMEDMEHRLKPTTMENKRNIIDGKLLPYFSRLKVCEIDTIKVRKWQNELISFRDENGKPYSQTYLKTVHNQLSAIMNYAVKHYGLASNPCAAAGSIGRSHAGEMSIWTQEEYELFAKQIKKSAMRLAFDTLFYTGVRSGELLALTPADILPDKRLDINKNFAKVKGEELFLTPKTPKSIRKISIPDFLYDDLQKYISSIYGIQPGDRIFYFTKSALEHDIKRYAKEAGLNEIRLHDLRHSHASMLIEMGFSPLEISERLGHESVKTTLDTYSHLYPDKDQKLADALNKLRRPGDNEPPENG